MKQTREQKKARLMARLEKAVDELLEWDDEHTRPTLTQIEDIVLKLRKEVGEEMASELLVEAEGKDAGTWASLPEMWPRNAFQRGI